MAFSPAHRCASFTSLEQRDCPYFQPSCFGGHSPGATTNRPRLTPKGVAAAFWRHSRPEDQGKSNRVVTTLLTSTMLAEGPPLVEISIHIPAANGNPSRCAILSFGKFYLDVDSEPGLEQGTGVTIVPFNQPARFPLERSTGHRGVRRRMRNAAAGTHRWRRGYVLQSPPGRELSNLVRMSCVVILPREPTHGGFFEAIEHYNFFSSRPPGFCPIRADQAEPQTGILSSVQPIRFFRSSSFTLLADPASDPSLRSEALASGVGYERR